jgi:hypothetical protein
MSEQQRFEQFVSELTAISRKHGVAIMSLGGVFILDNNATSQRIAYSCDAMRGDLKFNLHGDALCQTSF